MVNVQKLVYNSLILLDKSSRRKYYLMGIVQALLGIMDLLGVLFLSVLMVRIVSASGEVQQNLFTGFFTNFSFYSSGSEDSINFKIAISAICLLLGKTLLSVMFTRKSFHFLSQRSAKLAQDLAFFTFTQSILETQKYTAQEKVYALTYGVDRIILGVLGSFATLIADAALAIIMICGLMLVDFSLALEITVFFFTIGFVVFRISSRRIDKSSARLTHLTLDASSLLLDVFSSFREVLVNAKGEFFAEKFFRNRSRASHFSANVAYMPYLGKYIIESAVILGSISLAIYELTFFSQERAIGVLTLFLAASSRVLPSLLRVQQGVLQIISSAAQGEITYEIAKKRQACLFKIELGSLHSESLITVIPNIECKGIVFSYPNSTSFCLTIQDLKIDSGKFIALVGDSGSGKSTLVDILLGVLDPDFGVIEIGGMRPRQLIDLFPGIIGYVPQKVSMLKGTIRENVAFGVVEDEIDDDQVLKCLEMAQLSTFLSSNSFSLDSTISEWGSNLSGGQMQRMGIARALYNNPAILVLDEATSSLDASTEASIVGDLEILRKDKTLIVIAHRLSTIISADLVVYLNEGRIQDKGSFIEVRKRNPKLNEQAELLGITHT
jgi:ABC-type bacteriocin/lantibiotic exporter with double-glycine peptidase domain